MISILLSLKKCFIFLLFSHIYFLLDSQRFTVLHQQPNVQTVAMSKAEENAIILFQKQSDSILQVTVNSMSFLQFVYFTIKGTLFKHGSLSFREVLFLSLLRQNVLRFMIYGFITVYTQSDCGLSYHLQSLMSIIRLHLVLASNTIDYLCLQHYYSRIVVLSCRGNMVDFCGYLMANSRSC